MSILNSKRIKELREENEELKLQIREIYEKKWTKSKLDEVLESIRSEINDIKKEKEQLSSTLNNLNIEIHDYNTSRKDLLTEIEKLNNSKKEEQAKLAKLRSQIILLESKTKELNSKPKAVSEEVLKEIEAAETKRDELISGNKNLEDQISTLSNRVHLLQEQDRELTNKINSNEQELTQLKSVESERREADIKILEDKVKLLQDAEVKITEEMKSRINKLKEKEKILQERIDSKVQELKEAESGKYVEKSAATKETEDKLLSLMVEEQRLSETITLGKQKINGLGKTVLVLQEKTRAIQESIDQLKTAEELKKEVLAEIDDNLSEKKIELAAIEDKLQKKSGLLQNVGAQYAENATQLKSRIKKVQENIEKLNAAEELKKKLIAEIDDDISEKKIELATVEKKVQNADADQNEITRQFESKIRAIRDNLEQLKTTEDLKKELITEINDSLSEKEIKLVDLEDKLQEKTELLQTTVAKYNELSGKVENKTKEIKVLDSNLILKSNQLSKISVDLTSIEEKAERFRIAAKNFELRRDDVHRQLVKEREQIKQLREENKKLNEVLPLLEQRKREIKNSNATLENRFAEMLQKLTVEMNEINKKRSTLEQIIFKKEKDIEEQDQRLLEKVTALEESERVLAMRQEEISAFEGLVKTLNEQNELLKNELLKLDDKIGEKRNLLGDLQLENEMMQKKRFAVENNLQEILYSMNNRVKRSGDKEQKLNSEIKEYENRLTELNTSIKESMNELVELRTSLSNIKIEHEEHRTGIAKLVSLKKKLQDEISKHQSVLQKYQKINEKIKFEQAMSQTKNTEDSKVTPLTENIKSGKPVKPGDQFLKV